MKRIDMLRSLAKEAGCYVAEWSPGDGVTRYRFYHGTQPRQYYDEVNPCYTALGYREALTYLHGRVAGYQAGREACSTKAE